MSTAVDCLSHFGAIEIHGEIHGKISLDSGGSLEPQSVTRMARIKTRGFGIRERQRLMGPIGGVASCVHEKRFLYSESGRL